jgi:hypothetical protein
MTRGVCHAMMWVCHTVSFAGQDRLMNCIAVDVFCGLFWVGSEGVDLVSANGVDVIFV